MNGRTAIKTRVAHTRPVSGRERLAIWAKVRGMWKHRKPEPVGELRKIRKGWNRKLAF